MRQVPYTHVEHVLWAAAVDAAAAEALQIEPGSPVFVIERTTWMNDDAITRVSLMHPGESFRIVTRDSW